LEDAEGMFSICLSLVELDVTNWGMSKVTHFNRMFSSQDQNTGTMQLTTIDVSQWTPSSATTMASMFYGCGRLTELDMSGWRMPNLTNVSHMFADCYNLETLKLDGWQTSEALTIMDGMFNNCGALTELNMSTITTTNVKEFSQIFEYCYSLKKIEGLKNWKTGNGMTFAEMFNGCRSLTELDISNFDTSNANQYEYYEAAKDDDYECFWSMFLDMPALTKLTVGENFTYDEAKVTDDDYKPRFPGLAAKDGFTAKWLDVDRNITYDPGSLMPVGVAATYEACYEPISTN